MNHGNALPQPIPTTVITGFLGAGKTTVIAKLASNPRAPKLGLIVNEFGEMGFDGDLLATTEGCECPLVELPGGCICCTVAEDFRPAIEQLLALPQPPAHIIVETSGLAMPQPLVQAFNWPGIRSKLRLDGVITVVDGLALSQGSMVANIDAVRQQQQDDAALDHNTPIAELFADQLSCADLIVISKSDLLTKEQSEQVRELVATRAPQQAKILSGSGGEIPLTVMLGIGAHADDKGGADSESNNDDGNSKARLEPSHHEHGHHAHGHGHGHHGHGHHHDAFSSTVIPVSEVSSTSEIREAVQRLVANPAVLRVKGYVAVKGKPMRLVVQAVGSRVSVYFGEPLPADQRNSGALIVIGLGQLTATALP